MMFFYFLKIIFDISTSKRFGNAAAAAFPNVTKIYNESIKISCICLEILCIQLYAYYLLNNLYHLFRKDT
jgi:hypothetical protein